MVDVNVSLTPLIDKTLFTAVLNWLELSWRTQIVPPSETDIGPVVKPFGSQLKLCDPPVTDDMAKPVSPVTVMRADVMGMPGATSV